MRRKVKGTFCFNFTNKVLLKRSDLQKLKLVLRGEIVFFNITAGAALKRRRKKKMEVEIWIRQGKATKKINYETMTTSSSLCEDEYYYQQTSIVVGMLEEELKDIFGKPEYFVYEPRIIIDFFDYDKATVGMVCGNEGRWICNYVYENLEKARDKLRENLMKIDGWLFVVLWGMMETKK